MSESSDSDDYSSRVLNKSKKNDETALATKNNFMKELNHSNISHVAQKSFLQANESFVKQIGGKRKRESQDGAENELNHTETNKRKKAHHGGMKGVTESEPDEFVTVREVAKKKHKKKPDADGNFENLQEESEKKLKKKSQANVPTELDGYEGSEAVQGESPKKHEKKLKKKSQANFHTELDGYEGSEGVQKQGGSPKKHKKNKNQPIDENEKLDNFVDQSPQLEGSGPKEQRKRKNSIITSTQKERTDSSMNDSIQDLLKFEQKKLSIPNIASQAAEDEIDIDDIMRNIELKASSSKENKKSKKDKKVRLESENSQKMDRLKELDEDDPVHIIKSFQRSNSLQKVDYCENDRLSNLKENCPCFFVKVPVDLDPKLLTGKNFSLNNKSGIEIGGSEYKSSASQKESTFVVLGEKNQVRLEVSHLITLKLRSKSEPSRNAISSDKEEDIINDLLSKQEHIINSPQKQRKTKLEKSPVKSGQTNNVEQLDKFLKDGTKFLKDVKFVSFRFKNAKLVADLDQQTNEVLKKQVEFLQEQSASTPKYRKMKKELADETRELLQKRTKIMNKVGSDEELSDYF